MSRPKSAQGAAHRAGAEAPRQHLDAIAQDHRHAIAKTIRKSSVIDINGLECVVAPPRRCSHQGQRLGAQRAGAAREEHQVAHCGTVIAVRPGTTIAILLLLALLLVAGVIFVIRLNSVT